MKNVLLKKMTESLTSVLPVVSIVFLLNLTPLVDFSTTEISAFLISAVFLIVGIALFNLGADLAMTPIGDHIGSGLSKLKNIAIILSVCFAMGILITIAEPALKIAITFCTIVICSDVAEDDNDIILSQFHALTKNRDLG